MLDSPCVTLTPGALSWRLRACSGFSTASMAASWPPTGRRGIPLLEACILHGRGRYGGILVRKERKAHGSRKLIEGRLERSEPVVIVDDSVSSGQSMLACADALEGDGSRVEGGVCLVRFDYGRGTLRMVERGYRMAAVVVLTSDDLGIARTEGTRARQRRPRHACAAHLEHWLSNRLPSPCLRDDDELPLALSLSGWLPRPDGTLA